MAHRKLK